MATRVEKENGTRNDVQQAVLDESITSAEGKVILKGTFDFGSDKVEVLNPAQSIIILGEGTTTINGGGGTRSSDNTLYGAFVVDSPYGVTFQNLYFRNSRAFAIQVKAVKDLLIEHCDILNVAPLLSKDGIVTAGGITVVGGAFGDLTIRDNVIVVGGSSTDRTFGIQIMRNNQGGAASIMISGNTVRNTTAHGVVLRDINGLDNSIFPARPITVIATVEENTIITGPIGGKPSEAKDTFVDGIFCQGSGRFIVQKNREINCEFENSAGIRLISSEAAELKGARVQGNNIMMSRNSPITRSPGVEPPLLYSPFPENAGIELRKNCVNNKVSSNTILGLGRAALVLSLEAASNLDQNQLLDNDHGNFQSDLADVLIVGATNTLVKGQGTIIDEGRDTRIEGDYRPPKKAG